MKCSAMFYMGSDVPWAAVYSYERTDCIPDAVHCADMVSDVIYYVHVGFVSSLKRR